MKKSTTGPVGKAKKTISKKVTNTNPFTGASSKSTKSAYSTAAQKRMKADAEGTYKAVYTKTRVLPEIETGKIQTVNKRK